MKKDTTNDMTVGSPVSLIIKFMIPMCLGNLFQQFYNIADSIVAGKFIGVNALAAIGSTGSLMFFVTGWLNGLSSGFAIIVAQMFGAKKFDRMRHYVAMSIYLMAAFSIVMTIGFSLANKPILHLMNSPEEVFGDVTAYMGIIYAGLIITGAYNALAAFLRALGDSKSPLYFLIISAVINVILDVVFIVAFGMGVEGCGYATVIAQGISAVCCLIYIVKRFPILHLERKDFEICWDSFGRLLKLGIPMGLQFSITAIGTIIVQSAVNIYGPVHMAGFSAAFKILPVFVCLLLLLFRFSLRIFLCSFKGCLFLLLFLTKLSEKLRQHRRTFLFQNSLYNLYLMIKSIHLQKIHHRTCAARFGIHTADHYFIYSGLDKCPGAHLAWFQRHIHSASLQPPVSKFFTGFADCIQFCMGECIFICVSSVISTCDDLTLMHDHTADWHFFQSFCLLRLTDSFFHKTFLICQALPSFPIFNIKKARSFLTQAN